jgi:hypothetical protein
VRKPRYGAPTIWQTMKTNSIEVVTLEQGRRLKEIGFDEPCVAHFSAVWKFELHVPRRREMSRHNSGKNQPNDIAAPEHWQVVDWLMVTYDIWVGVFIDDDKTFGYEVTRFITDGRLDSPIKRHFKTKHDAYSAAFDHVLTHCV